MKRSLVISALVFAGLTASAPLVLAQTSPAADEQNATAATDRATFTERDDNDNWGWIGLLGLAGLMGLKRREDPRDQAATRRPGQPA